jgi:hypothetical protein
MANEKLIKQTITVCTEIINRLINPSFRFSKGGTTVKTLSKFIDLFVKEYGSVTKERLVDFCVCTAYTYKDREKWTVRQFFGRCSLKRLRENKKGAVYYEDLWLSGANLDREYLASLIIDREKHPQSKYIYVSSEESSKRRLLNHEAGYLICQTSTLGWSPESVSCSECVFIEKCKKETQIKYPELYRIRLEYGEPNR